KYGACYIPKPFMQWRYVQNSLANGTTTWQALKIVKNAARQMRSPQFRDCFPESYVRRWEEHFRSFLLRQHLSQITERRESMLYSARDRATRFHAEIDRLNSLPILGSLVRRIPGMTERIATAREKRKVRREERRLDAEVKYLHSQLDPALKHASFPRRFCDSVVLPPRRFPPLRASDVEPDGGHGFRVSLDRLGIFASSDQESVSLLRLYEDGKLLTRPHHAHDAIRTLGAGRFSHWGSFLHFAASDNSDPRTNGRKYVVEVPRTLFSCARSFLRPRRAA